jgi:transglutaminase-like putative cysteine protease
MMRISFSLPRQPRDWLTLAYVLAILPLYEQLQPVIYGFALLVVGWRYALDWFSWPIPKTWIRNLLALAGCVLIILLAFQQGLLPAMLNLLVLGCTLKFLEFRSRRDLSFHVLSLFFLIGLALIYHQGLGFTLYALLLCLLISVALLSIFHPAGQRSPLMLAGIMLVQSLPLLVVFFLLIPRTGNLWRMPDTSSATTGLSETLSPGQITQLTRNSALVFRARFDGPIPSDSQRYWRTLVHEDFDGQSWQVSPSVTYWQQRQMMQRFRVGQQNFLRWIGPKTPYTIIAEPSHQHWFYALDFSYPMPNTSLLMTPALTLWQPTPQDSKQEFSLLYFPASTLQNQLSGYQRQVNLALPPDINPQTRALVAQLQQQAGSDTNRLVSLIQQFFIRNQMQYTLQPPPMTSANSIDELLFQTRKGFCAHFASSVAFMMRTAGIPARVVSGYLGGELHAQDHYLSIYQFDAHAWVEIWQQNHWQRIDPTLWVVPERLTQPLDDVLAPSDGIRDRFSLTSYRHILILAQLHALLATMDYRWTTWVLHYNAREQTAWLGSLFGSSVLGRIGVIAAGIMALTLLMLGLRHWQRVHVQRDPWSVLYLRLCQLCARQGFPRQKQETPRAFAARLAQQGYEHANLVQQWVNLLEQARYQPATPPRQQEWLQQARQLYRQLKARSH